MIYKTRIVLYIEGNAVKRLHCLKHVSKMEKLESYQTCVVEDAITFTRFQNIFLEKVKEMAENCKHCLLKWLYTFIQTQISSVFSKIQILSLSFEKNIPRVIKMAEFKH